MSASSIAQRALDQGNGIVRLAPTWVPRSFCVPGRRIKLHPDDYYVLGGERGGIDERWFASTTPADNGPLTAPNEGLSFIVCEDGGSTRQVTLKDAVAELKGALIGEALWQEYGAWPMYSKFFDNKGALPFHIHHKDEQAADTNLLGKPEAYYFPRQANNHGGDFPYTFFGLEPGTTKDQVRECLANYTKGDNKITLLSRAYKLEPGTGWDVPAGTLHAPGSLCTYEPQKASDVFAICQSLTGDQIMSADVLWHHVPEDRKGDVDYLIEMIDWEINLDPEFANHRRMVPVPARPRAETEPEGWYDNWICYRSPEFSAKELTVMPGATVTVKDAAAYGLIMMQGHGTMGEWPIETPSLIRYGQLTYDEFFVSEQAAREGVTISNPSRSDPIVMLKHFGPGNPDFTVG